MSSPKLPYSLLSNFGIIRFVDIDTDETIRQRIANTVETIPQWIWLSDDDDKKVYILKNQVTNSMDSADKTFDGFVLTNFNGRISSNPYGLNPTDIAKYWLSVQPERIMNPDDDHVLLQIVMDFERHGIDMIFKDGVIVNNPYDVITKFYREERKRYTADLKVSIKANQARVSLFVSYQTTMSRLSPMKYFDFQQEKVKLVINTKVKEKEKSLSTIFANIVCDHQAPLFSYHDVYKVVDDLPFLLPLLKTNNEDEDDDWSLKSSEVIRGYISHEDDDEDDKSNYTHCYFYFEKDEDDDKDNKTLMIMLVLSFKSNESKDAKKRMVLNRLQSSLRYLFDPDEFDHFQHSEEGVVGIAIFPHISFENIILSHMIMNDGMFSTIMSVDESEQTSKLRDGLYVHFFIEKFEGTCSITSKIKERDDQELKFIKETDLPEKSPFVRVRITLKIKNMDVIDKFLTILSKLLTYYHNKEESIRKIYTAYRINTQNPPPKIKLKAPPKSSKKSRANEGSLELKKRFPDIFSSNYSGVCDNNREIKWLAEKPEGTEYEQWMTFPKNTENYFSCGHNKDYPYIGVQLNTLSNKDTLPYLPCCFKLPQLAKEKSNLPYYLDDELPPAGHIQQRTLLTNKFASTDGDAELPDEISFLFRVIRTKDDGSKYLRMGVRDTPLSFLDCVLKATPRRDGEEPYDLDREYGKLIKYDRICVASQENPGKTVNDMRETLREKRYMDPRRWIRLLEIFYDVKIIIFSKNPKNNHVSIQLPHHDKMHLRWLDPNKSVVCIYEHYGNERDKPRCELIIEKNEERKLTYHSFIRSRLNIDGFYNNMLDQWYYTKDVDDEDDRKDENPHFSSIKTFRGLPFLTENDKQAVDPYGKTRAFLINNSFVILTSPLPSLNIPAMSDDNNYDIYQSYNHNDKDIQRFLSAYNPSAITLDSSQLTVELHFFINNITLTIKTKPFDYRNKDRNIKKIVSPLYPSSNQNSITNHIDKRRIASIMIEYFIYFFSVYCKRSGLTSEQVDADKKGAMIRYREHLVVDEKVVYSIPQTSTISIEVMKATGFMSDDNKFICDSKESRKRLLYTLYTHLVNQFQTVMSYVEQSEIHNFYSSVSDYAIHNHPNDQTLTVNDLGVLQLVNGDVHNMLQLESDTFFMKNDMISSTPVQVKKASTRKEAVIKGMRKGCANIDNEEECPVRYFLYQSKNDIDVHGREDETNADVLVYKIKDKIYYNGLLIL